MATAAPGRSKSLPDHAQSSAAWELGSTAHKTSGDYNRICVHSDSFLGFITTENVLTGWITINQSLVFVIHSFYWLLTMNELWLEVWITVAKSNFCFWGTNLLLWVDTLEHTQGWRSLGELSQCHVELPYEVVVSVRFMIITCNFNVAVIVAIAQTANRNRKLRPHRIQCMFHHLQENLSNSHMLLAWKIILNPYYLASTSVLWITM
jgi:hypothetical protein